MIFHCVYGLCSLPISTENIYDISRIFHRATTVHKRSYITKVKIILLYVFFPHSTSTSSFSSFFFSLLADFVCTTSSRCRMLGRAHNNNNSNNLAHGKKSNFPNAIKAFVLFYFLSDNPEPNKKKKKKQ